MYEPLSFSVSIHIYIYICRFSNFVFSRSHQIQTGFLCPFEKNTYIEKLVLCFCSAHQAHMLQSSMGPPCRSNICLHFLAMERTSFSLAGYLATAFKSFFCHNAKESFGVSSLLSSTSLHDQRSAQCIERPPEIILKG